MSIIYRFHSEHARPVDEFMEMMRRRYPDVRIVQLDTETRDGAAEASLYGVMQYPSVLVTANDGSLLGLWEGLPMPLIDSVAGLLVERQ
jgi:hypothetical protein